MGRHAPPRAVAVAIDGAVQGSEAAIMSEGQSGEDPRYPVQAPGWAAIDRALGMLYPGQVPHQFTSERAYDLEGQTPLPAVAVYEASAPAHWHFVSYGLTELFEKSSPDAGHSGFGFELTLRLPKGAGEETPPVWAVKLMQVLGHYVLSGHAGLDTGHVIDLGGPLAPPRVGEGGQEVASALEGVVLVPDPRLGQIDTPFGKVLFLQLLTGWDLKRKVGLVMEYDALAITDPGRGSMREDRRKAAVFRRYELGVMIG
jgi:hypothetical protein